MKFSQVFNARILLKNSLCGIFPDFQQLDFNLKISSVKCTQIFNCWILFKNFQHEIFPDFQWLGFIKKFPV
jgi:hypothetical protein